MRRRKLRGRQRHGYEKHDVAGTTADQRPDDEAFCDVLGESAELANAFTDPTTDPAVVAESFARLAELFARLAELAPEEVRDDVAMVADAIIAVNTTPTDDPDALSKALDVATSPEVTKATEAVGRYAVEACGMSPEAGKADRPVRAADLRTRAGSRPGHRICAGPTWSRSRALARRTETGCVRRTTIPSSVDTRRSGDAAEYLMPVLVPWTATLSVDPTALRQQPATRLSRLRASMRRMSLRRDVMPSWGDANALQRFAHGGGGQPISAATCPTVSRSATNARRNHALLASCGNRRLPRTDTWARRTALVTVAREHPSSAAISADVAPSSRYRRRTHRTSYSSGNRRGGRPRRVGMFVPPRVVGFEGGGPASVVRGGVFSGL